MTPWWQNESLLVASNHLFLDGRDLNDLACQHGTPLYVYSRATVRRQLEHLQAALAEAVDSYAIYYAMKANRSPGVLQAVRETPGVGVDTCSPREVDLALAAGFAPHEISFNAGMLSDRDLAAVAASGVSCILDSFSALRRYGGLVQPGTRVGLRINPGVSVGYSGQLPMAYGNSKFGFEPDDLQRALEVSGQAGLVVDTVHTHLGWGLQDWAQAEVEQAIARLAAVARQVPDLRTVNVGGGLGARYRMSDQPLRLAVWSRLIRTHLAPLGVTVACEPGTFVASPAGVLLVEANTVEERRNTCWIGIDAGFAVNPCPALYGIPIEVVPLNAPAAMPQAVYTVAGHINEATDIWAYDRPLPLVREGDLLALLPAGAYGASMASDHCLRGQVKEITV